jgi:hypothetical protein
MLLSWYYVKAPKAAIRQVYGRISRLHDAGGRQGFIDQ